MFIFTRAHAAEPLVSTVSVTHTAPADFSFLAEQLITDSRGVHEDRGKQSFAMSTAFGICACCRTAGVLSSWILQQHDGSFANKLGRALFTLWMQSQ